PHIMKGKGRPKGAIATEKTAASGSTRRDPSLFERVEALETAEARVLRAPPSTAPAAIHLAASSSSSTPSNTTLGLHQVADNDSYEPGTQMQRSYQRVFQHLEDTEDIGASSDAPICLDDDNPQELTQNTAAGIAMAALAALEGIGLDGGEPGDLNL
ncbi:hypothetical protein H9Q72_014550, partial [Fusarium xylarioides]